MGVTIQSDPALAAGIFDALGDPNRLRIVARLCAGGPSSTSTLAAAIPATRQAAAKHLRLLESTGVVDSSKRGRERIWHVRTTTLSDVVDYLDQLSRQWDRRIDRLRKLVETDETT